ncbi:MAG: UDP-N-acetylmuramate dehydrogenase [candidate division WOR-3 bacterium]
MKSWYKILNSTVDKNRTKVLWNQFLCNYTTFKIGGKAECFVITNSDEEIKKIIKFAKTYGVLLWVIGNGSNLLISDQGINGITLKLGNNYSYIKQIGNTLMIGASTPLSQIVKCAYLSCLSGVEFLWGIPGTFGGAIVSNAGAFSHDIGERVISISGITPNGEALILNRSELKFQYRKSELPSDFIITKGIIELTPSDKKVIKNRMDSYFRIRKARQPRGASAGSVFKNPQISDFRMQEKPLTKSTKIVLNNSISAGKLIDELNLKGLKCGGAFVSQKHGNFIINQGGAKFYDVYELIQIIKCKIEQYTGIVLQEEIQILPKVLDIAKWRKYNKTKEN